MKLRNVLCIALSFSFTSTGFAQTLLVNDPILRNDLNWLVNHDVITLSLSTWPLSEKEVSSALSNAKISSPQEQQIVDKVKSRVIFNSKDNTVKAYTATDSSPLPSSFGFNEYSQHGISTKLRYDDDNFVFNVQGTIEGDRNIDSPSRFSLAGSYTGVNFFNQWLTFGQVSHWWGPGNESSLIYSDAARPVIGFNMQRAQQDAFETKWLSWIGKWQYQIVAGQLSQYKSVPHAKFIGMRVTAMPFDNFEIGASRTMQWAGEGRPSSWGSFWDAATGDDNERDGSDPGNQLAGFDAKLNLYSLTGLPMSLYGQIIGEDEAGGMPSSKFYLAGIESSNAWGDMQINSYLEGMITRNDGNKKGYVYTHHHYKDGYYQQGYPLGAAIGGDGKLVAAKIELVPDSINRYSARLVYAEVNPLNQKINKAFPKQDTIKGVEVNWDTVLQKDYHLTTKLWLADTDHSKSDKVGLRMGIEVPFF